MNTRGMNARRKGGRRNEKVTKKQVKQYLTQGGKNKICKL